MSLSKILEKINSTPIQKGQKVAVAFSGGLDSSLAIPLLKHIYEAKEIIPIPDNVWMWRIPPNKAMDKEVEIGLEFSMGLPISRNGKELPLDTIIDELNQIAGSQSIGLIDIFEDGIMELKSREVYEAPAAHVILKLHRDLEQQCLTKDEIQFKKIVDAKWAYLVYHGLWYSPLKQDLDAFILQSQQMVCGKIKAKLYKGNIEITNRESKYSLFAPEVRSIKSASFDQRWCAHAAKIRGLPCEILATRQQNISNGVVS